MTLLLFTHLKNNFENRTRFLSWQNQKKLLLNIAVERLLDCLVYHDISLITGGCWGSHLRDQAVEREKLRWELHKNAKSYFEWILKTTSHKTAAVRPLTSNLTNYPSKTNKTYKTLLVRQGNTYTWRSFKVPYTWMCLCLADQQELTDIRFVWTLYVVWKTCQEGWVRERERERERESQRE